MRVLLFLPTADKWVEVNDDNGLEEEEEEHLSNKASNLAPEKVAETAIVAGTRPPQNPNPRFQRGGAIGNWQLVEANKEGKIDPPLL